MVRKFPEGLLGQPLEDRHRYFNDYTVSHPSFQKAFNDLIDRIYNGSKNSIILAFGPAGAGKSKLIKKVQERLIKDNFQKYQIDRGLLPILAIEAVPPDQGSFDWKDFYYRCLVQADEILIDYKMDIDEREGNKKLKNDGKAALRRSLENVLTFRKPLAFFIDEAQHITMTTNSRNLRNQINILKSLANLTNVPIVLSGNYDLLTYRDLNGQTIRRGKDIHVRRYDAKNRDDLESFINVLLAFQQHLPLPEEPDLINNWDYFYSRSIGCIGILKDWLYLTYQVATNNNANIRTLEIDDFRKHELPPERSIKLLRETTQGETKYEKSLEQEEQLYIELGLIENTSDIEDSTAEPKETKGNKKPGQRKPHRDTVGIETIDEAL
jgi:hypothetical protein